MIPRINFHPTDRSLPIEMERKQFPVRLCFAVTSNKSQGQTLKHVGIYLQQDFFSHGQLYVALSRVQSPQNLKIYRPNATDKNDYQTTNVVFKEVLTCQCLECNSSGEKVPIDVVLLTFMAKKHAIFIFAVLILQLIFLYRSPRKASLNHLGNLYFRIRH